MASDIGAGCSPKTCQRRLNTLVELGILEKQTPDEPRASTQYQVNYETLKERVTSAGYEWDAMGDLPLPDRIKPTRNKPSGQSDQGVGQVDQGVGQVDQGVGQSDPDHINTKQHKTKQDSSSFAHAGDPTPEKEAPPPEEHEPSGGRNSNEGGGGVSDWNDVLESSGVDLLLALADYYGHDLSRAQAEPHWMQIFGHAGDVEPDELEEWVAQKYADLATDSSGYDARAIIGIIKDDIEPQCFEEDTEAQQTNTITEESNYLDTVDLDQ